LTNIFDLFKKLESISANKSGPVEFIVCGLGNPGPQYERTRHNAGFMAIDEISAREGFAVTRAKFDALVADVTFAGKRVLFMKPQTYMNASGKAVGKAAEYYKIPPERIIVISDDVNLPVGKMRIRRSGSSGGQKGLADIINWLGTDAFPRIRIGVGAPPPGGDMISWVLGSIPEADLKSFKSCIANVPDAVSLILAGKIDEAMNNTTDSDGAFGVCWRARAYCWRT